MMNINKYEHDEIKGLYYVPNYLTVDEAKDVMDKYLYDENKMWEHIGKNNVKARQVIQYGYEYAYNRSGLTKIDDLPIDLSKLVQKDRINKIIGKDVIILDMEQLIINKYLIGQGINYHVDHPIQFGPIIACISIGSSVTMNFRQGLNGKVVPVQIEPNSLYIMSGDARMKWQHGILKQNKSTRYSLTFRTINKK